MDGVLLVFGHGREQSLCHRLAAVLRDALEARGARVRLHDLLADDFDPRLRLAPEQRHAAACDAAEDPLVHRYQRDVRWAGAYVVVHPVWWFAPPAILKGWVDRVLVDGVANLHDAEPPTPLLGGRRALVVQTFNAPLAAERDAFGGITGDLWRRVVFPSVGVADVDVRAVHEVAEIDEDRLARFEDELRDAAHRLVEAR